jgi:hypothetical protein
VYEISCINHGYDREYGEVHEVIKANTHTFRKIIGSFNHCLVHWADSSDTSTYTPLADSLKGAAKILNSAGHRHHLPPIVEVDLSNSKLPNVLEDSLAKFYQIQKVPTLTFFEDGNPFPFNPKNVTAQGISQTLRHMSKPLIRHLDSKEHLAEVLRDGFSYKVVYFGPEHHEEEHAVH